MRTELTDDDIRDLMDKLELMPDGTTHQDVMREIAKALDLIDDQ